MGWQLAQRAGDQRLLISPTADAEGLGSTDGRQTDLQAIGHSGSSAAKPPFRQTLAAEAAGSDCKLIAAGEGEAGALPLRPTRAPLRTVAAEARDRSVVVQSEPQCSANENMNT